MEVMQFELTADSAAEVTMPMEITLPKILWIVLAQLAKDSGQPIEKTFQRIFEIGIEKGPILACGIFPVKTPNHTHTDKE
jgi:hypothetical protein